MASKNLIRKEISVIHFLLLSTSKLLIGIGLGLVIATKFFFLQPYWYLIVLAGALILIPVLRFLTKAEFKEEIKLRKKI